MAGNIPDEIHDLTENNRDVTTRVCTLRVPSPAGQRQWSPIYLLRENSRFSVSRINGIRHTLIPPDHPASNGAAERAVGILKQALLKDLLDCKDGRHHISLQHKLAIFLLQYRSTPHSTTGRTPAELFLGRQL